MLLAFDDPEREARYLDGRRRDHAPRARGIIYFTMATYAFYFVVNAVVRDNRPFSGYGLTLLAIIALCAAYGLTTRTASYRRFAWADFPFTVAIALGQVLLNRVFLLSDRIIPYTMEWSLIYNGSFMLVFGGVLIAGSVRWYLAAALSTAAIYVLALATLMSASHGSWAGLLPFSSALLLAILSNIAVDEASRRAFILADDLEHQKTISDDLLYNVLPHDIVARLKNGDTVADAHGDLSVIFIDIVDFSHLARKLAPRHLVELLNSFFSVLDDCAAEHRVEKVKTIGDAYLAVAGATIPVANSALAAIAFGRAAIAGVAALNAETGIKLDLRVGIHTGFAIGGVVGSARKTYDYWGDTINVASRIEGASSINRIAVSESTVLRSGIGMRFSDRRVVDLKGVGETVIYVVSDETGDGGSYSI